MLRLFYALPCPPAIAEQINAWRREQRFAGKPVPADNLHLTLAFLGHLPESRLALLERLPLQLPLAELAFELWLDRLECWPGGLLHLAPSQPPAPLLTLADGLDRLLLQAGLPSERRAYRPHLTLARDSRNPVDILPPVFAWRAEQMLLYSSDQGRYRPLSSWPLG